MQTLLFHEHETLITSLSHCYCSRNIHISQLEYHGWKKIFPSLLITSNRCGKTRPNGLFTLKMATLVALQLF